jgi:hypothetical protein
MPPGRVGPAVAGQAGAVSGGIIGVAVVFGTLAKFPPAGEAVSHGLLGFMNKEATKCASAPTITVADAATSAGKLRPLADKSHDAMLTSAAAPALEAAAVESDVLLFICE